MELRLHPNDIRHRPLNAPDMDWRDSEELVGSLFNQLPQHGFNSPVKSSRANQRIAWVQDAR